MRKSCGGWQEEERKEGGNLQQQEGCKQHKGSWRVKRALLVTIPPHNIHATLRIVDGERGPPYNNPSS